jgi:hypothetical protein
VDDYNKEAVFTVLRATVAPSFQEARAILAEIVEDRITDPDVAQYVEFAKDLSRYCTEHGIQRGSAITLVGPRPAGQGEGGADLVRSLLETGSSWPPRLGSRGGYGWRFDYANGPSCKRR